MNELKSSIFNVEVLYSFSTTNCNLQVSFNLLCVLNFNKFVPEIF